MPVGLDSNIVCYMLDLKYPEHEKVGDLLRSLSPRFVCAVNPTVVHESYHALVYGQTWTRQEARRRLGMLLRLPFMVFFNQTKSTTVLAMSLAERYVLGGRDSLILANFLANKVLEVYTHDSELLRVGEVEWRGQTIRMVDPVAGFKRR